MSGSLQRTSYYTYDQIGNITGITSNINQSFDWEGRRLIEHSIGGTTYTYTYNDQGIRTSRSDGTQTTTYFLDGSLVLFEKTGNDVIYYTYDADGSILSLNYLGDEYFYIKNLQGDIIEIVDASGTSVAKYRYDAWGNIIYQWDSGLGIANANPYRYRSYRLDSGTGLYYLNARYYDPSIGRFISADSINYLDPSSGQGLNLYAYCGNNPVMYTDSDGYAPIWNQILAGVVIAASVISVVVGTALLLTGVGATAGAVLIGVGVGGLIGSGGSIISQWSAKGWDNIDWGQVAFNGAIGMATGALMASSIGAVATGFAVGGLGFTQSVGNDLFGSNGDWGQVSWGRAIVLGLASGVIAGAGKYLTNSATVMNKYVNGSSSIRSLGSQSLRLGIAGRQTYTAYWMNVMIEQTAYRTATSVGMNLIRGGTNMLINYLW